MEILSCCQEAQNSHVYWVSSRFSFFGVFHKDRHSGKLTPAANRALFMVTINLPVPADSVYEHVCVCGFPAVAVLYPSGEHGQRGGSAEREALEDLQPVRNPGDGPRTRGRRQG